MALVDVLQGRRQQLSSLEKDLLSRGNAPEVPITSLPTLNRMLWGLRKGLTVIGSRTSQGKSAILSQITLDCIKQGIPTLFLSLEMTSDSMLERMFSYECEVNNYDLLSGQYKLSTLLQDKFKNFSLEMSKRPLQLVTGFGKTLKELLEIIEQDWQPSLKVVCLDYVQMVRGGDKERENLQEYIRQFRDIMLRKNMVGLMASQVNRTAQDTDNRPTLAQLKSTGALEEVSDTVLLLNWPYFYTRDELTKNNFELLVAKNRFGQTGLHRIYYTPQYYKFTELAQHDPMIEKIAKDFYEKV